MVERKETKDMMERQETKHMVVHPSARMLQSRMSQLARLSHEPHDKGSSWLSMVKGKGPSAEGRSTRGTWVHLGRNQVFIGDADEEHGWNRVRSHGLELQQGNAFEFFTTCVLVANSVTIALELQLGAHMPWIAATENVFLVIYLCELCLNFLVFGKACVFDHWVKFDMVVVGSGVIAQWILTPFQVLGADDLGILVMLRLLRLFRLARTFKLLMKFRELALLIEALLASGGMMLYTLTVLIVLLFIFGCAGCEFVGSIASDPGLDPAVADIVVRHFGTLTVSMLTMMQFVCMDSIAEIYRPIMMERPELSIYFVTVTLVVAIVAMNLVTGVIINSAMEQAMENKAVIAGGMKRKKAKVVTELRDLFYRLDKDVEGTLTLDELISLSEEDKHTLNEVMQSFEPEDIFNTLEVDGNDMIPIDEFIDGVWDIVAAGTSPEVKRMQKQVESMHTHVQDTLRGQQRIVWLIDDLQREWRDTSPDANGHAQLYPSRSILSAPGRSTLSQVRSTLSHTASAAHGHATHHQLRDIVSSGVHGRVKRQQWSDTVSRVDSDAPGRAPCVAHPQRFMDNNVEQEPHREDVPDNASVRFLDKADDEAPMSSRTSVTHF